MNNACGCAFIFTNDWNEYLWISFGLNFRGFTLVYSHNLRDIQHHMVQSHEEGYWPKIGSLFSPNIRVPATKFSNFWRKKKPVMLLSISLDKFKILISLQDVQKIMRIFTSFYSDYSNFLIKYGFLHNFVAKKSLWQSFKNRKSEMTVEKYFLFAMSWCIQIFL